MGTKLLWTAVVIALLISPVIPVPAADIVAAVLAVIGVVLLWLDK